MQRRLLLFSLAALLISLVWTPLAAQESGAALQLIDSEPLSGQELGQGEAIALYFDRVVDCATVASGITVVPEIAGTWACADNAATLTPVGEYARATVYTVTLGEALRGADGARLLEEVKLEFSTAGFLSVAEVFPAPDATDISPVGRLTVIFSRPVVPLGITGEVENLPQPLLFEPVVTGRGEWVSTSIYSFTPDPALLGGTEYRVQVDPTLATFDGLVQAEPFAWEFSTAKPQVIQATPRQGATVPLHQTFTLRFDQPMDRASTEAAFYLYSSETDDLIPGTFTWNEGNTAFTFEPSERLFLDLLYIYGISLEARAANGGGALLEAKEYSVATVPLPAVTGSDPRDGASSRPYGGARLFFASPMNIETLEERVRIDPAPAVDPDFYYSEWNNSYSINFSPLPSTRYTITLEAGAEDIYGNRIERPFTFSYTTERYDPDVSLRVPYGIGFYNAYREPTELFITSLNVSALELTLRRVDLDTVVEVATDLGMYGIADYSFIFAEENALIREWTIARDVPENVVRYERLNLGAQTRSECPGAMPTRLQVGDSAIVISDPDPVRARSAPGGGEIVDLLYKNYALPIVGGPECIDGILWWEVTLRDQSRAWVAEAVGDEYLIDVRVPSQTAPVTVEMANGDRLPPGLYHLEVQAPELRTRSYTPQRHVLVVATAVLTMKTSTDSVTVWATDVQSGASLVDVPIRVYGAGSQVIAEGRTNAEGIFSAAVPRVNDLYAPRVAVLNASDQFGMTFSDWTDGLDPWQFGQNYDFYPSPVSTYAYTDRPVYRTDQPVYFRGVVRAKDDVTYTPLDRSTVPVTITDPNGDIVFSADLPLTPFGTFSGQFDIAADASLGSYYLNVDLAVEGYDYFYGGGVSFLVAEYRLPEFRVEAQAQAAEIVRDEMVRVDVESTYFFGGAVSGGSLTYNVIRAPYYFSYSGPGYYSFFDYDADSGPGPYYSGYGEEFIASGEGVLDAQGRFTIEVPADVVKATTSQTLTVEATVTDESQQAVSGRASVIVHSSLIYAGVRPESYVGTANQESAFEMIVVDWDSQPVANQVLDVEIVERRWSNVQEQDDRGRTTWKWEVEEISVANGSVTSGPDGKARFAFTPPNGGVFKARVTTRDTNGNQAVSASTLWVSSREYVSWRQQNSNRIDLIIDQDDYQIGDTARILITSPFQGTAQALVTVERGDILSIERITLDSNSYVYEVPITEDYAPNAYVSVFLVKGVDANNPVATFRMGMVQFGVEINRKEISIDINTDVERAQPQQTVTYTVRTTDYKGDPVSAEVGIAVTDLAALSLAAPNSGPILSHFYGEQGLGIRTASGLTINTDQLTQEILDTVKGGGGGFAVDGIIEIRGEFVDTPYWNATVVTDVNGVATVDVRLPDNLTTWRLDARAVTSGSDGLTLVGQDTFDLLSTKPLIIRPVTPRFFVVGDQAKLGAVVNNNTEEEQEVVVTLRGAGYTLHSDAAQVIRIPAGGRGRVNWDVVIDDVFSITAAFTADAGAFTDGSISGVSLDDAGTLPVYRYEVPETVGTAGMLRDAETRVESIVLPRRFEVTQGEVTIHLDQSLAASTLESLEYLRNFPHQCVEQTVSRFLPNIMTYRALQSLGLADEELRIGLERAINEALQKLYAEQKSDGGWGWFLNDRSNELVTAYALIGLVEARAQGMPVSESVTRNAINFLKGRLESATIQMATWRLNRQAFMLYALARAGEGEMARMTRLYDVRARLSNYAQALLAQAFWLHNPENMARVDVLISDLLGQVRLSATGMHWEENERDYYNWNTDIRTTAMVLDTLVKVRPQSELLPNVVRYLMVQRKARAWETTQETAWAVMALTSWMIESGELQAEYAYSVAVNGENLLSGQATPATVKERQTLVVEVANLLKDEANLFAFTRGEGSGVLYYSAFLRAYLPVPEVEPLSKGITIQRRYTLLGDESRQSISEGRVGDLVQVRLTVIAPTDLHYVVIEDPLPGGAEGIDPNLQTSQQIGTAPGLEANDPWRYGWGWWYFSRIEFRDEKVQLYSTYLPAGTYEYVYTMRLGVEGVYNVIPPTGQEFYFPDVYGRGAGSTFTILPAES